jgi:ATP-dependent DNA helicase RecQ
VQSAIDILQKYWGFSTFREHQIPVINSIIEGRDTFALLTTGGGKSICFQVPAMMKDGVCIVVSPLIALMKDQVAMLNKLKIPAAAYYSSQPSSTQDKIIDYAIEGKLKFIYISPERLVTNDFIQRIRQMKISYLVIDEAHCISQWGYDFRPSYLKINQIYSYLDQVSKIALTATATPRVIDDIIEKLELDKPNLIQNSFFKSNLSYQIIPSETKFNDLAKWIQKLSGSGLVYVNRRSTAEELVKQLKSNHNILADYYHAGLSIEQRNEKQENWIKNPNSIMISTNAFGMGIDNPHVNFVIHYNISDTLEAYFQEAGRGGRAGQKAHAIGLISQADIMDKEELIFNYPSILEVKNTLLLLFNYFEIPYEQGYQHRYEFLVDEFIDKYKLNGIHTSKCIQILKDNELIRINDAFFKADELQITATEQEIQSLGDMYPEYGILIRNIIRSYDGIFYTKKISLQKIAKNYHYNITELRSMLKILDKKEILIYTPSTNRPTLEFLINKSRVEDIPIDMRQYQERKEIITSQLQSVIDFVENTEECRSYQLLSYLGELDSKNCGICDVCLTRKSLHHLTKDDFIEIKNQILENLSKSEPKDIKVLLIKINQYPVYAIRRVLDRLIELNLIEKQTGELFILK